MIAKTKLIPLIFSFFILTSWTTSTGDWIVEKHNGYKLLFKDADRDNIKEYSATIDSGISSVKTFFNDSFKQEFEIYVHPDRQSLNSQWQEDWDMPGFKSECWMVASGVATKLDMISPKMWDKESCEHHYSEKLKTRQLITHELFHVYHGQENARPDFNNAEGIDWFVEGLATYAAGQCDSLRTAEIKKAITENTVPATLGKFWTGKLKYGLSGSVVMYIDNKYGRQKLKELLKYSKNSEILDALKISETALLSEWRAFINKQ